MSESGSEAGSRDRRRKVRKRDRDDGERGSRGRGSGDEGERGHKHRDKHKRSKSHKHDRKHSKHSSKHKHKHRHRDEERSSGKRRRSGSPAAGAAAGGGGGSDDDDRKLKQALKYLEENKEGALTMDHYFERNTEFRHWLLKSKKIVFEDLSSEKARSYFKKFVRSWNAGELPEYYKGLSAAELESTTRTRHRWGFAKKMSDEDRHRLHSLRDSVAVSTSRGGATAPAGKAGGAGNESQGKPRGAVKGPTMPSGAEFAEARYKMGKSRHLANKAFTRRREEDLEDLVPKETGREAIIAARRARNAEMHAAARQKDEDGGLEAAEADVMGTTGSAEFKALAARQRSRRDRRTSERSDRLSALRAAEEERMRKFRAEMGITGDVAFKIPERPPGT